MKISKLYGHHLISRTRNQHKWKFWRTILFRKFWNWPCTTCFSSIRYLQRNPNLLVVKHNIILKLTLIHQSSLVISQIRLNWLARMSWFVILSSNKLQRSCNIHYVMWILINIWQMFWHGHNLNHGRTMHPMEKFISLNLIKILLV